MAGKGIFFHVAVIAWIPLVIINCQGSDWHSNLDVHADPTQLIEVLVRQWAMAQATTDSDLFQDLRDILSNSTDFQSVIEHPVNLLILYSFWSESKEAWRGVEDIFQALPEAGDAKQVALSILRLQTVYNITADDMADGNVRGHRSLRPINKHECFLIFNTALEYVMKEFYCDWYDVCTERFVHSPLELGFRNEEFTQGLEVLDQFMERYRQTLNKNEFNNMLRESLPIDIVDEMGKRGEEASKKKKVSETTALFDAYRSLCRLRCPSSSLLPLEEKCNLYESGSAFGRLAPLKLEFHAYDPMIVTIHDVLSDEMAENLKAEGIKQGLEEPKSVSGASGKVQRTGGRTGKIGFFPEFPLGMEKLSSTITGLSTKYAEPLQIVSYGIGGHYEPHLDYFRLSEAAEETFASESGDRIATLIYYLNDVTEGGATVFPRLGLAIHPQKGSALLWYNLYKNGVGDPYTLHAGCPVLVGSKWITNQWFREKGQAFIRPCSTDSTV